MSKIPTAEELRSSGHMTIDEFIEKFTFGLKEHLRTTWGHDKGDSLHHPEDLAVNASVYADAVYQVIGIFGVANTNTEEQ